MRQQAILRRTTVNLLIACCAFLLLLWGLVIPVDARQIASISSYQTTPTNPQATPTTDPGTVALEKEKLHEEVTNLQHQNDWRWNFGATILSIVTLVLTGVFGTYKYFADKNAEREKRTEEQKRWLKDRESEREKRAEEKFQGVVAGLASDKMEMKIGSAMSLRTFLTQDDTKFYTQSFEFSVAYLRSGRTGQPLEDTFRQALIIVFKESFLLIRDGLKNQRSTMHITRFLNASGVQLDVVNLDRVDLIGAWLPQASLQYASLVKAQLSDATFTGANLAGADLTDAKLERAHLEKSDLAGANLQLANLQEAYLNEAHLIEANLSGANVRWGHLNEAELSRANLVRADLDAVVLIAAKLEKANLEGASLENADVEGADLKEANLRGTNLKMANLRGANLAGAHPETARTLQDTDMRGVTGLSKEQLRQCAMKGAIIDP